MNVHRIRAITLDLDDTLWEIAPVIRRAESELWQWLQINYPRIVEKWSADEIVRVRMDLADELPDKAHDFRFLRKTVLKRIAVNSGYSEDLVEPAFDVFDAARNRVELFPEVLAELSWLTGHFRLVAITNGNANLQTIGIAHYFDDIVTSVEVGIAKPARPIFDEAINRAGVEPHETLHVGDHPESDILGAHNAGMRTGWINRTQATWPDHLQSPDIACDSMSGIRQLLEPAVRER